MNLLKEGLQFVANVFGDTIEKEAEEMGAKGGVILADQIIDLVERTDNEIDDKALVGLSALCKSFAREVDLHLEALENEEKVE